jgi:hypothetical protein
MSPWHDLGRSIERDGRVVHEGAKTTSPGILLNTFNESGDVGGLGDVEQSRLDTYLCEPVDVCGLTDTGDDVKPPSREPVHCCRPDPARRPGDNCDFLFRHMHSNS